MHVGGERPLRFRAVASGAYIAEPVEEIFNPEAAKSDGNPFPEQTKENETDYESMTVDELKALLRARGLSVTGTKAELIARLTEADTPSEEEAVEAEAVVPSDEAATSDEGVSDDNDENSGNSEPVGDESSGGA